MMSQKETPLATFRNTVLTSPSFFKGMHSSEETHDHTKASIMGCIHILLTIFFISVILYALVAIKTNIPAEVFTECAQDLWTLLLMHIVMPLAMALIVSILAICLSGPTLLYCTNRNTFWVICVPTLLLMVYSCTMLTLGVQYISKMDDHCTAVLIEPTKALSPQVPLLTVLLWVFVALDSILLLVELCFLIFMICIQINAQGEGDPQMAQT
jgi:hypothetical protein